MMLEGKTPAISEMAARQQEMFRQRRRSKEHVSLQEKREKVRKRFLSVPLPDGASEKWDAVAGVPVLITSLRASDPGKILFHVHGGGFFNGSPYSGRFCCPRIAAQTKQTIVGIDYRLAPEYHYPAGVEDCLAVYRELLKQGYRPDRMAMVGDSAGGNLILSMLVRAKAEKLPMPAAAALYSPATGYALPSHTANLTADVVLGSDDPDFSPLEEINQMYSPDTDPQDPSRYPLCADLAGFPPLHIVAAENEMLADDSILLAEKAGKQGVYCKLSVWPGMHHAFVIGGSPEAEQVVRETSDFFQKFLA